MVFKLTSDISQNPAPLKAKTLDFEKQKRILVEQILATFIQNLPSNYISESTGPAYVQNMQAVAELLAEIQLQITQVQRDLEFDFTRGEFLFQFIGSLVFPTPEESLYLTIDTDLELRRVLSRLVQLLTEGSKSSVIKEGIKLLTSSEVILHEKGIEAEEVLGSLWDLKDQFEVEIFIQNINNTFPDEDPFTLQNNIDLILKVLKPAYILYNLSYLFTESFKINEIVDSVSFDLSSEYYDDFRKFCGGQISVISGEVVLEGDNGSLLASSLIFEDVGADFNTFNNISGEFLVLNNTVAYEVVQPLSGTTLSIYPNALDTEDSISWVIRRGTGLSRLTTKTLVQDITRSFEYVPVGSKLQLKHVAVSTTGEAVAESNVFNDNSINYFGRGVQVGYILVIPSGSNAGSYTINSVSTHSLVLSSPLNSNSSSTIYFIKCNSLQDFYVIDKKKILVGTDPILREFTTYPTGLNGEATVEDSIIYCNTVDFATCSSGEIISFLEGPNLGSFRLENALGLNGGPLGDALGPCTSVSLEDTILQLNKPILNPIQFQPYEAGISRLGRQRQRIVIKEDVSSFFELP